MSQHTGPNPNKPGRWVITEFGPPSVLSWETMNLDEPLPNDSVLVRVIAAGIAGPDNLQRAGGYPNERCAKPGFTPGYDMAGEVVATGESTFKHENELRVGDFVASMCMIGAHASHIILPRADVIKIRPDDDFLKVSALPLNYMTAWGMLRRSGVDLQPNSSILIGSAAGGVGTAIAQVVHAFKMDIKMYGTCSPSKFDFVRSLGIEPIDRHVKDLANRVLELTGGVGVDVAYDAVGSVDSLEQSLKSTKAGTGKVIAISVMGDILPDGSGMADPDFDPVQLIISRQKPGINFWGVEGQYYRNSRDLFLQDFEVLLEKVRSGELDPIISQLYPLSDAVAVHEKLVSGTGVTGKMMFVVDEKLAKVKGVL